MAGLIAAYLHDLGNALPAGERARRRFLCEAEQHLLDRAQHYRERGVPADDAERQAVVRFGPAALIARHVAAVETASRVVTASRTLLAGIAGLYAVYQVGGHFLPAGSRPRDIDTTVQAVLVDAFSLAFLAALAMSLIVLWRLRRHRWRAMGAEDLRDLVAILVLGLAAEVAAALVTAAFVFHLPGRPPLAVHPRTASSKRISSKIMDS